MAAENGHVEVLKALLGAGADAGQVNEKNGTFPLLMAAAKGHAAVIDLLVEAGADRQAAAPGFAFFEWREAAAKEAPPGARVFPGHEHPVARAPCVLPGYLCSVCGGAVTGSMFCCTALRCPGWGVCEECWGAA